MVQTFPARLSYAPTRTRSLILYGRANTTARELLEIGAARVSAAVE